MKNSENLPLKYCALLSCSYSGSTLLSILIGAHQQVVALGDTYLQKNNNCSQLFCTCGRPILDCAFRMELDKEMQKKGRSAYRCLYSTPHPFSRFFQKLRIGKKSWYFFSILPKNLRRAVFYGWYEKEIDYLDSLKKLSDALVYLDGSKNITRVELLSSIIPNMKVIHLIKDPRGFIYSAGIKRDKNLSPYDALRQWIEYNDLAYAIGNRVNPGDYKIIHYEDVVRFPNRTIRDLYNFIGLSQTEPILDIDTSSQLHLIGNSMRLSYSGIKDKTADWEGKLNSEIETAAIETAQKRPWFCKRT